MVLLFLWVQERHGEEGSGVEISHAGSCRYLPTAAFYKSKQVFPAHAALPKAALPGFQPCLTKMRMGFEPHGQDSQGKWSLLRAPTSRLYPCPSSSQGRRCSCLHFPTSRGSGTGLCYFYLCS